MAIPKTPAPSTTALRQLQTDESLLRQAISRAGGVTALSRLMERDVGSLTRWRDSGIPHKMRPWVEAYLAIGPEESPPAPPAKMRRGIKRVR